MWRVMLCAMKVVHPAPAEQAAPAAAVAEPFLTVAVSSRALFDLDAANAVYEQQGVEAYRRYQIEHEDEVLKAGPGFAFARKLLAINKRLGARRVDVILLSRNSSDTGLRVFNSIDARGLDIVRAAFSGGTTPYRYAKPFGCQLFLSTNGRDVAEALEGGMAAATLLASQASAATAGEDETLRIAFDGDAVLFDDQAERLYQERGLDEFNKAEVEAADKPLAGGLFKPFLEGLHRLQVELERLHLRGEDCPIRTALVSARGAPAHKRVVKTLRAWGVRVDESLFLGGKDKGEFLRAYPADVFFDDQRGNCENARSHVTTGHVPHGVTNENAGGPVAATQEP